MALDRFSECPGLPVVHQSVTHADSPERRGSQLIGRRRRVSKHDGPIASPDIVQQEITIGVDEFVTNGTRNCIRPAIDDGADRSRLEGGNVTDGTANLIEKGGSSLGVSGGRQNSVSGWSFRAPEETGEGIDSLLPGRSMAVFRIWNGIALGDNLVREDAIGDPQVTEIS